VISGSRVVAAQPYIVGLSEEASKGSFFCGGTYHYYVKYNFMSYFEQ